MLNERIFSKGGKEISKDDSLCLIKSFELFNKGIFPLLKVHAPRHQLPPIDNRPLEDPMWLYPSQPCKDGYMKSQWLLHSDGVSES